MMLFTFIYLLLAMVVADTVTTIAFKAALREAKELEVDNEFTRSPRIALTTQFVLAMLLAPAFLVIACMPNAWDTYVAATRRIVLEPREIQS